MQSSPRRGRLVAATPRSVVGSTAKNPSLWLPLWGGWRDMAAAWWQSWREALSFRFLPADVLAGITVAAVALPLNLALAVAADLPPSAGLIAGAVGGGVAALFGGSTLQVTGPAAALNVMVLALGHQFGAVGVAAACIIIGIIQLALGFLLAGRVASRVPESVLAGFTTGVGLKLLDAQMPELLGFDYKVAELAQMMHRPAWLHDVSWLAAVSGLFVAFVVTATRQLKRFPAAIVAVGLITFVSVYVGWDIARVGEIPSTFPKPTLPLVADEKWLDLLIATVPLALLAAIETLLSARAVDRMSEAKVLHNPNLELVGQGLANTAVGLMSGMPVTGVVVRSGVNVQSGGKTRLSALVHAVMLALAVLVLSRTIAHVPLAALAGLLCVIGFRLIEVRALIELAKNEKVEALAFVVTMLGTVTGHLMTGLVAGLALHAANRFLHRGEHAQGELLSQQRADGVRAVLGAEHAIARRPMAYEQGPSHHAWLSHMQETATISDSAFVHHKASLIGRVVLGDHVHIAAGSSVRADEGTPFFIGSNSNIQDGVVIHALKDKHVRVSGEEWAVYVGRNVSIAHNALVHGPCYIGDDTFIGFKAVVHDAIVGAHCFIGIGAVVVGVEIPDGRLVPHGRIVDSADAVDALPRVTETHREFNEDVVDVNRGLAVAYQALNAPESDEAEKRAESALTPSTWEESWTRTRTKDRF